MATKLEKETIINLNEEEEAAYIWTASPAMARTMTRKYKGKKSGIKLISTNKTNKDLEGKVISWEFECPKKWIEARETRVRNLNKEQKEEIGKMLTASRKRAKEMRELSGM